MNDAGTCILPPGRAGARPAGGRGATLMLAISCRARRLAPWAAALAFACAPSATARRLEPAAGTGPEVCDAVWHDPARDRDVPVRIRIPGGAGPVPVILFSHGLGGSVDAGTEWAEAWSRNGFAVVHLQHPGSDAALWRGRATRAGRRAALRSGISGRQLVARVEDVKFVLDRLGQVRAEGRCDLSRLDLLRVGMAGHSFGAHTTQAVAGQLFPGGAVPRSMKDPRIRAAVALSPAPPYAPEEVISAAFAEIEIPFFSITGTHDTVPFLPNLSAADRILPHRFMPAGHKYLLVFEGAEHRAFGGDASARTRRATDPHVSDVVRAATLAFWRATLLGDEDAAAWLAGGGVHALLRDGDRFEAR